MGFDELEEFEESKLTSLFRRLVYEELGEQEEASIRKEYLSGVEEFRNTKLRELAETYQNDINYVTTTLDHLTQVQDRVEEARSNREALLLEEQLKATMIVAHLLQLELIDYSTYEGVNGLFKKINGKTQLAVARALELSLATDDMVVTGRNYRWSEEKKLIIRTEDGNGPEDQPWQKMEIAND